MHYGIDFGANAWRPDGGIAQAEDRAQLERVFTQLAASGVQYVRWFLFCDGRGGIEFSAGGRPLGLDDFVFRDVDAALDIASRHGIRIMFVLLDFLWCDPVSATRGVQMGGRSHVLADAASRDALLDAALRPLLERYGDEPADSRVGHHQRTGVDQDDRRRRSSDVSGRCVGLIHSSTCHPVTVGSAGVSWRDRYTGIGLDFYQVHWYDGLKHQPSLETPVSRLGFDRPVLLGEFPTRGSKRTAEEIVEMAQRRGIFGGVLLVGAGEGRVLRFALNEQT